MYLGGKLLIETREVGEGVSLQPGGLYIHYCKNSDNHKEGNAFGS